MVEEFVLFVVVYIDYDLVIVVDDYFCIFVFEVVECGVFFWG